MRIEIRVYIGVLPDVIARRQDVYRALEEFLGNPGRDAATAGGVLAVGDDEVGGVLADEARQELLDRPPPGPPEYVTYD